MIADPETLNAPREHWETPHEPAWQTAVGCLVLVLSLAVLWVVL